MSQQRITDMSGSPEYARMIFSFESAVPEGGYRPAGRIFTNV
jgi:hypothetical protein